MKKLVLLIALTTLTGCVGNRVNYTSVRIETMGDNSPVRHYSQPQYLNADKQYSDVMNPKTNIESAGGK